MKFLKNPLNTLKPDLLKLRNPDPQLPNRAALQHWYWF